MHIGHLNQKASPALVGFVFACIIMTVILLYFTTKTEAIADNWSTQALTGQN